MNWKTPNLGFVISFIIIFSGTISSCGVYSLSGIAIDYSQIQTISIQNFYDESTGGPPNLAQRFTEELRDYYQRNTQLTLENNDGDLHIEGNITGYNFSPVAPVASGNPNVQDLAGSQRLTISINVTYINTVDDEQTFENRRFSFFDDYNPDTEELSAVEERLIENIFEQVIYDIFNATVANW
ncbi:MAG: LptE family protein [Candidatus Cyclobacteriaceae bacterium M3_2C_046]